MGLPAFFFVFYICSRVVLSMAELNQEQRSVIKFFVSTRATPIQCWRHLQQGFQGTSVSQKTVRKWHKRFREGDGSVKDRPRSGRPRSARTPETIQAVQDCIQADRRIMVRDIAEQVNIGKSSAHSILKKDLKQFKLCPKFIPKVLTPEQKLFRVRMCELNMQALKDDNDYLKKIVTGDESWVSVFEIEIKRLSCEWHPKGSTASRPTKALRQRSERKCMLTAFFDETGEILVDFKDPKVTVDSDNYCDILRRLKEQLRRRRPEKWVGRNFFLHHDNAPTHTAAITLALIGSSGIDMIPHPPYSPDLAPCDYYLFPRLKNQLRGHRH